MGLTAALKLRQIGKNFMTTLALELLCAAQGIDFRRKKIGQDKQLGAGTAAIYKDIRSKVPFVENDEYMKIYIDAVEVVIDKLIRS
jgi:histidine ammonia-lyase